MDWAELRQEYLDHDLFGHLLQDGKASEDFLIFLEEQDPLAFQKYLNAWVKTKDGTLWYQNTLDYLIQDVPDNDEDRDR